MRHRQLEKIRWVRSRPSIRAAVEEVVDEALAVEEFAVKPDPLAEAIRSVGIPRAPAPLSESPLQEAIFLLQKAAEIEHALLVQYLYAAYSLDDSQGNPPARWQGEILQIAREEMGHLITVQNILMLLGAPIYLGRQSYPADTELYPFPLELEPLTLGSTNPPVIGSLAKYVIAESPFVEELPGDLKPIGEIAGPVNHVGVVYAMIYWLLQETDAPQGPWQLPEGVDFPEGHHIGSGDFLPPENNPLQTKPAEWGAPASGTIFIDTVTSREAALEAINRIAKQGEGLQTQEESHYEQFLRLYREVSEFAVGGAQFARDVPRNPHTTVEAPDAPGPGLITNAMTLGWARLFNVRYEMLLLDIAHAMSFKSSDMVNGVQMRREMARDWGVRKEMIIGIGQIARRLTTMLKDSAPGPSGVARFAAPPFELPVDDLPVENLARWQHHRNLIERSDQLINEIGLENDDELGTLAELQSFDAERRQLIQAVIDGLIQGGTT